MRDDQNANGTFEPGEPFVAGLAPVGRGADGAIGLQGFLRPAIALHEVRQRGTSVQVIGQPTQTQRFAQ